MKRLTITEFIETSNKKHHNKYDYSLVEYKNNKTKVIISCPKHGIFKQRPNEHMSGQGCPGCKKDKLSELRKFTNSNFLNFAKNIHGEKYDYSLVKYNGTDIKVKIICDKHGVFEQRPHNHLKGQGCPICNIENLANDKRLLVNDVINISSDIHNNKYDYSLVDYKNNKTKIKIICPIHGEFKQSPIIHMIGSGCPKCNTSKGEKNIIKYLTKNKINYIHQKTFDGCKYKNKLHFDFYLPEFNLAIEFDGEQHFNPIDFFGGIKEFEKLNIKDSIKNNFCIKNDIYLLRVPYYKIDDIELILNNKLNN